MSYFKDWLNGRTAKTTPADADNFLLGDSADSNKTKKVTWANIKATLFGGCKFYDATLTQSGSSAPTITLLQNTLGQTVTAARSGTGEYTLTAGGAVFTANKTQILYPGIIGVADTQSMKMLNITRDSTTVLTLKTAIVSDFVEDPLDLTLTDGLLTETAIRIVVWP